MNFSKLITVASATLFLAFGSTTAQEYKKITNIYTPITASSIESEQYPAVNLIDGDAESRWASAWEEPQTIEMDLSASKPIDKIVLKWESAFARTLKIYGKKFNENSNWELMYEVNGTLNGGETVIEQKLGSYRYLKFEMADRALQQYGISLFEIEVYSEVQHALVKEITFDSFSTYDYGQHHECNSANHGKMILVTHNYKTTTPHSFVKVCLMNSYQESGKAVVYFDWVNAAIGAY